MTRAFLYSLTFSLALVACSGSETVETDLENLDAVLETAQAESTQPKDTSIDEALTERGVTLLAWEDLMPEGEEELLTSLYEDFYREFEERLMSQQTTLLSSSNNENVDLSLRRVIVVDGEGLRLKEFFARTHNDEVLLSPELVLKAGLTQHPRGISVFPEKVSANEVARVFIVEQITD